MLLFLKNSFVLEKGLEPKKPLYDESGDGCTDVITKCLGFVIIFVLLIALLPHNI
jgi:hypothetical protein